MQSNNGSHIDWTHICWLGGSPCSGKSTISTRLGKAYDIHVYHVDDALYQQIASLSPTPPPATDRNEEASAHDYASVLRR